ncbi:hypothetical protein AB6O49_31470 [Streptomyces sp. SBR177]
MVEQVVDHGQGPGIGLVEIVQGQQEPPPVGGRGDGAEDRLGRHQGRHAAPSPDEPGEDPPVAARSPVAGSPSVRASASSAWASGR